MRSLVVAFAIICGASGANATTLGVVGLPYGIQNLNGGNLAECIGDTFACSNTEMCPPVCQPKGAVLNETAGQRLATLNYDTCRYSSCFTTRNLDSIIPQRSTWLIGPYRLRIREYARYFKQRTPDVLNSKDHTAAASIVYPHDFKVATLAFHERYVTGFRLVRTPLGVEGRAPREESRDDGCDGSSGAHSELPPNQRSLFVRISGLIDRRLSCDTVAGNPFFAVGIALLLQLIAAWGVWRIYRGYYATGAFCVCALLFGGPALFMLPN